MMQSGKLLLSMDDAVSRWRWKNNLSLTNTESTLLSAMAAYEKAELKWAVRPVCLITRAS